MSGERDARAIGSRLSLRAPQSDSLHLLSRICERIALTKDQDLGAALLSVKAECPAFQGFDDRRFVSLCFALATGVGKTRLMGAFIAWLHRAHGVRDFLVLAPNLTIYEKLIRDFTAGTNKYVLQGIEEFAVEAPEIITGDNFETGRGVRDGQLFATGVHINVFNISKINSEMRNDREPRVRKLIETIGEPYFSYLAGLERLVVIMDESHRYRATAGVRALNELCPVLGLELTATPQVEDGKHSVRFGNVVYDYPLAAAIRDQFVKKPAVGTRLNTRLADKTADDFEELKLLDGVRVHEVTKVELEIYAATYQQHRVKPFVLVIARDTEHASAIQRRVESETFFDGRYRGKVIQVHSKQGSEEKDEVVKLLLEIEDPSNPIEIVIHVNMLKEGWDVTNLYTIVPLRTADSKTLVEQSIGRGLRLPYGRHTGIDAVDTLTIIAHDRFQEIVDYARKPDSVIQSGLKVIDLDALLGSGPPRVVEVRSRAEDAILGPALPLQQDGTIDPVAEREREVRKLALDVIKQFEHLPHASHLMRPEVERQIVERVVAALPPAQADLTRAAIRTADRVHEALSSYVALTISIPKITVVPKQPLHGRYRRFKLDLARVRLRPMAAEIALKELQSGRERTIATTTGVRQEPRLENYVIRQLFHVDGVDYQENADVLNDLAEQVVAHLRSYLADDAEVRQTLEQHEREIGALVLAQMEGHYEEPDVEYEFQQPKGFQTLRGMELKLDANERSRDFRQPVAERQRIPSMLFGGFERCMYPDQRFDSDPERRLAVLMEAAGSPVRKWIKPARDAFRIYLTKDGSTYTPDFVAETDDRMLILEVKARDEIGSVVVEAKSRACLRWCEGANHHARLHGGKPWSYVLIPDDEIDEGRTFTWLADTYTRMP